MIQITDREKIFSQYHAVDDWMGFSFKALESRTSLSREKIRTIVRDLASEGYLSFKRGCMTDEGLFYGSAYVLTPAGRAALANGGE